MNDKQEPILRLAHVTLRHGPNTVLSNVTLEIMTGEIVTIVGPNGSGKSSLLRAIVGALPLAEGTMTRAPGLRIGYVPQKLSVDATLPMTVNRFLSLPRHQTKEAVERALHDAGATGLGARQMATLSGGQFQRVLLARALLERPNILLLDEATQGLDQPGSASFFRQIEAVRRDMGCAILMVSHELHVVMSASDRVICLNGHICCEGTPEIVASAPEYRALFGTGTQGALALYRHDHNHTHDETCDHDHSHRHQEDA